MDRGVGTAADWTNWARLERATPVEVATPRDAADVAEAVRRARESGTTVKMVGTGHSFTGVAAPEHTMLLPRALSGVVGVDRAAMTVTALAGTPLHVLNTTLARMGLSLHNMGDIAEQTLAGAVSTGTHGTGGVAAGLAAQVAGLEMVTGSGELLRATPVEHPEVLDLARVGLGALGVLTTLTFRVEPLFVLEAHERPARWEEVLESYDDLVAAHHHVDLHWIPTTDAVLLKTNDRLDAAPDEAEPLPAWREWWESDVVENTLLGAVTGAAARRPTLAPRLGRLMGACLSERRYSDVAHRVFTSPRRVLFAETEWALPRAAGIEALRELRRVMEARRHRVCFPVEVRCAPADDVPLSTSYGRDTFYVAVHQHRAGDHADYFRDAEAVLRSFDGRPHWGKLHHCTAEDLRARYPRFDDFLALRDALDPGRVFANDYLRRVLGD